MVKAELPPELAITEKQVFCDNQNLPKRKKERHTRRKIKEYLKGGNWLSSDVMVY